MNLHPMRLAQNPATWLLVAMAVTVVVYWNGLHGPFLLDDDINFAVIQRWLAGNTPLSDVLFGNTTGSFGRPVSMATLAVSAWLGGYQPFAFKLGNLFVHLLCGVVIYRLVSRMARRDPVLGNSAKAFAALIASLWLLHPLQASTVLYAVQRMAQMSTLFLLLGLWLYMALRERLLDKAHDRIALIGLFLGIPLLLVAAALAKENGLLLIALCLVLELGCFPGKRAGAVKAFFGAYLLLPFLAGLVLFAMQPARLMGGYLRRDFSWSERLLTQPRALCDYLWQIIAPTPSRMGIYTDDFVVSTGWATPPTTLVAILVLAGISVAAWKLRRRIPGLFIGWGLFLIGHGVESSILPLEMYFEHRNYLPMLGALYASGALAIAAGNHWFRQDNFRPRRVGVVLCAGVLGLFAFQTHGLAQVWSNEQRMAGTAAQAHPESMRAQMALITSTLRNNDIENARQLLIAMTHSSRPRVRAQGNLILINVDCATRHSVDAAHLTNAIANAPSRLTQDEKETFQLVYANTARTCAGVTDVALAQAVETFLARADTQPDWLPEKASLAYVGAQFYARAGSWGRAREMAVRAWQPGMPAAMAAILIQAQLATDDVAGAERTYREASARINPQNQDDLAGLRWLRGRIDAVIKRRQGIPVQ